MADDLVHDRDAAWELLTEWTKSEALLRHALGVEAPVRAYARKFGEDEEAWGNVALLHDFDYERHPTLEQHPQDGAPVLRERGYPEWFIHAIQSHGDHTGVARETQLEHTLYACDELSGFVQACGFVRPEGLSTLEPKSVRKKLKQPSFAAGVHRDEVFKGAEELGVELDDLCRLVIGALEAQADELELHGKGAAA
jgi:putative nucleotidyltransferase with HDIG domain